MTTYAILGCGTVGTIVAEQLAKRNARVLILDNDPKQVTRLREQGLDARVGDIKAISPSVLDLGVEKVDAVLILTSDADANLAVANKIKAYWPKIHIISRAIDLVSAKKLMDANIDHVIHTSDVISKYILRDLDAFETRRAADMLVSIIDSAIGTGLGIFLHNNPDPDAIAAGLALKKICDVRKVKSMIFYGGEITHQENKALVNLLDIELNHLNETDNILAIVNNLSKIALIDVEAPGANNVLPKDVVPNILIDHHHTERHIKADFYDSRSNIGATATIMTRYMQELNITPDPKLAAALLFGIRTDTKGFTRSTSPTDLTAAAYLSPYADKDLLATFESPPMSVETLEIMGKAIMNREIYGPYLITCVDSVRERDALPQAADFLLNLEGITTVLVFGIVGNEIHISARSNDIRVNLGEALKKAFDISGSAGGHVASAAAQISLGLLGHVDDNDKENLINLARSAVKKKFFAAVGVEIKS